MAFWNGFSGICFQPPKWCQKVIDVLCSVILWCKMVYFQLGPQWICYLILCIILIIPLTQSTSFWTAILIVRVFFDQVMRSSSKGCHFQLGIYQSIHLYLSQAYIASFNACLYPEPVKAHYFLNFHLCHSSISPRNATFFWDSSFRLTGWILVALDEWVSECFLYKFPIIP